MSTHRRLYRRFLVIALALAALFLCGFGPPTLVDSDGPTPQRLTVGQLRQMEQAGRPPNSITAQAVLVYDVDADRVLIQSAAETDRAPASLAKLMTALLILEKGGLDQRVVVEREDLVGEATMGLARGELLTVEELLWGLLIPSGNDAAMALARHHSGQVHLFVQRMNLRAQELGLTQTNFLNPHGFDEPGQITSAQDLLTLTRLLWGFPLFRQIVGTQSTTVAGHALVSTNQLLGTYPGANGVKTGTTTAAGQNLVAGIDRNGHQLFAVILGSQDRYFDARTLVAAADNSFAWANLGSGKRLTALDRVFDIDQKRWFIQAESETPALFLPIWERQQLSLYRRLQLPPAGLWSSGASAGVLEWRMGEKTVATQRLVLYLP
ncbi:MAG: D-alanyl-D-alanine carboxypeptidase [Caldilineaceae bacterium]|nr:D-alanyl-D-alanine carboxypeptidase [Caldilineaceae bacterium]